MSNPDGPHASISKPSKYKHAGACCKVHRPQVPLRLDEVVTVLQEVFRI
jgi:hypothetical protein